MRTMLVVAGIATIAVFGGDWSPFQWQPPTAPNWWTVGMAYVDLRRFIRCSAISRKMPMAAGCVVSGGARRCCLGPMSRR